MVGKNETSQTELSRWHGIEIPKPTYGQATDPEDPAYLPAQGSATPVPDALATVTAKQGASPYDGGGDDNDFTAEDAESAALPETTDNISPAKLAALEALLGKRRGRGGFGKETAMMQHERTAQSNLPPDLLIDPNTYRGPMRYVALKQLESTPLRQSFINQVFAMRTNNPLGGRILAQVLNIRIPKPQLRSIPGMNLVLRADKTSPATTKGGLIAKPPARDSLGQLYTPIDPAALKTEPMPHLPQTWAQLHMTTKPKKPEPD